MPNPIEKWKLHKLPEGGRKTCVFALHGFPADLLRDAKMMAVVEGKTLKQFAIEAIERAVKDAKQKWLAEDQ